MGESRRKSPTEDVEASEKDYFGPSEKGVNVHPEKLGSSPESLPIHFRARPRHGNATRAPRALHRSSTQHPAPLPYLSGRAGHRTSEADQEALAATRNSILAQPTSSSPSTPVVIISLSHK